MLRATSLGPSALGLFSGALFALAAACSSSLPSADGGGLGVGGRRTDGGTFDGGAGGGAGARHDGGTLDGGGGTRRDGFADGTVAPYPTCLQDLEALCPVEAVCQAPSRDAGGFVRACPSGTPGCTDSGTQSQIAVYKADGSLCYTFGFAVSLQHACETATYTWTDSSGQVVATGQGDSDGYLWIGCGSDPGANPTLICTNRTCLQPGTRLASACACASNSNSNSNAH